VCEEECRVRGIGWVLTRDDAEWDTESESSLSTISIPTTADDEEPLTEMERSLLEGHVPEEMALDLALK
jgi:hypothetical protein